jgi:hypothetical protein
VTTVLAFTDRIKELFLNIIDEKNGVVSGDRTREVETPPPVATRNGNQRTPLPRVHSVTPASVAALLVSGKADRLWMVSQEHTWNAEQTHSNMG